MRTSFLPFSPPCLGDEEINEVIDTLRSDWITTGPKTDSFEREFAAFLGAPCALAVNSGTAALHVALAIQNIGPGDTVITTPLTFCSSVHVIEQVGARPLLVDVEPNTLNISPCKIADAVRHNITSLNIRAILPVHLYGHPCDMEAILDIARQFNFSVIEDAAHALPAKYKGQYIGSAEYGAGAHGRTNVNVLTCFSFYATKNLTTAEGGMLTGTRKWVEEARLWSLHGMSRDGWKRYSSEGSWYYEVIRPGFKYNMTDIQAAIGLHQLRKLPQFTAKRREIVRRYNEVFTQFEELQIPTESPEIENAYHLYVLRLNVDRFRRSMNDDTPSKVRNRFIKELQARNIGTSVHFIPIHLHPYYRDKYGYKPDDYPVAFREYQRMVSLPLNPRMSDEDVEDVIKAVVDVIRK